MIEAPNITIGWRLRVRMAENRITTATELKRRLDAVGYEITSAQLSRILDYRPAQVKTALLEALLKVLGGTLDDLMPTYQEGPQQGPRDTMTPPPESAPNKPKRVRKPVNVVAGRSAAEDIGGPRVHPFPIPKK